MSLVEVRNLRKRYGRTEAVSGISFGIGEGRCVALLGPNGAGKTTTLGMLSGLLKPTEGSIVFHGLEGRDIRQAIGYLPQFPAFYNWMTVREFLEFAGKLAHMHARDARQRTDELLERVGLKQVANRRIGRLSGGMKQRLGIAQALVHRPRLVLLDEPVSALDPAGRRDVLDLIRTIKQEATILFSTHVLHDAEAICDDLLILNQGKLAVAGALEEVRNQYRQPLVMIQSDRSLEKWAKGLGNRLNGLVKECDVAGTTARLLLTDLEQGKRAVLADLVAEEIPVNKFEVAEMTLEDVFMKVVES